MITTAPTHPVPVDEFEPADHAKTILNILDDHASGGNTQTTALNILEDSTSARLNSEDAFKATLNILSDLSEERVFSFEVQRALLNLLEDSADERSQLGDLRSAVINILEDFDIQREAAEAARDHVQHANSALESFSYSVAHDLRSPLRAIDGFSRILIEEHADRLDSEGRRLLDIVVANVGAMGRLIDDLLVFSRLGRSEISMADTDMTEMVRAVDADLRSLLVSRVGNSYAVPERIAREARTKTSRNIGNIGAGEDAASRCDAAGNCHGACDSGH